MRDDVGIVEVQFTKSGRFDRFGSDMGDVDWCAGVLVGVQVRNNSRIGYRYWTERKRNTRSAHDNDFLNLVRLTDAILSDKMLDEDTRVRVGVD
jgi:hypothetical protein